MWWSGKLKTLFLKNENNKSIKSLFLLLLFQSPIVSLLSSAQRDLRRDAAGTLGNVAMSPELIVKVVEAGALPPLIDLAKSSINLKVRREVIKTLYSLSYDEGTRRLIVQHGGLEPLVNLASDHADVQSDVQEKAAGCLANIACGKGNKHYVVRAGGLQPLLGLLRRSPVILPIHTNLKNTVDCTACQAGQYLGTDGTIKSCQKCEGVGAVSVENSSGKLRSSSGGSKTANANRSCDPYSAQRQAARALFAVSGLPENQKCIVTECDGLKCLITALESKDHDVCQYSAGAIANMARGVYCGNVVREGSVSRLLQLAKSSVLSVQVQAIRGLKNIFCDITKDVMNSSGSSSGGKEDYDESDYSIGGGGGSSSSMMNVIVPGPDTLSNERQRMIADMTNAFDNRDIDDLYDLSLVVSESDDGGNSSSVESKFNGKQIQSRTIPSHWAVMASSSTYFANLAKRAAGGGKDDELVKKLCVHNGGSAIYGKECWKAIVEYCYVGKIRSPCEDIFHYYNDRRARRKATSKDKKVLYKKCQFYYDNMHSPLVRLIQKYQINGMMKYILKLYKLCSKLLKRPSTARKTVTSVEQNQEQNQEQSQDQNQEQNELLQQEQRFSQLLRCRWGLQDVVFRTGDGTLIGAHRVIICARSAYFRAMLAPNSQFSEASMEQIPVQVEDGCVFSILIRYMYTGVIDHDIEPGNCFDILNASHLYGLNGLQTEVEDYISNECMNIENAIDILNATADIFVPRLRMSAITYVVVHFDEMNDIDEIENININDACLKEFMIDRYYHWNQGSLWGTTTNSCQIGNEVGEERGRNSKTLEKVQSACYQERKEESNEQEEKIHFLGESKRRK